MAQDQPPEIMSVYNGHLMTLCSVPVLLLHRHHTAVSAALCRTSHKDVASRSLTEAWRGIGNLLQKFNWIIAETGPWVTWGERNCLLVADFNITELLGGRQVLCNVRWAPGLCRHHIRCLVTDHSGVCRLSWSVITHVLQDTERAEIQRQGGCNICRLLKSEQQGESRSGQQIICSITSQSH